jgi:hypothetical protein
MSNSPRSKEQNEKIELTPTQLSPRDALASDFIVNPPLGGQPGHHQRGRTAKEERDLLAETEAFKPQQPISVPNKSVTKK